VGFKTSKELKAVLDKTTVLYLLLQRLPPQRVLIAVYLVPSQMRDDPFGVARPATCQPWPDDSDMVSGMSTSFDEDDNRVQAVRLAAGAWT